MTDAFDQVKKETAPTAGTDGTGTPAPETAAPAPEAAAPAEKKKKRISGKKLLVPLAVAVCVLALLFAGIGVWGYSISVSDRNLPNVFVGSVPVGGMTRSETASALEAVDWTAAEAEKLTVTLPAGASFDVGYVRAGMALGRDEAIAAACAYGHDGDVFGNLMKYLRAQLFAHDVLQQTAGPDMDYIRECAIGGLQEMNRRLTGDVWKADMEAGTLSLFKGAGGVDVDADGLYGEIVSSLRAGAETLRYEKLRAEPDMPDFQALYDKLYAEPADAYFTDTFDVVPEVRGCSFDVAEAQRAWQAAAVGETVQVPLQITVPDYVAEELRSYLYRDLLGEQTTYYTWSTAERINNIEIAASRLDGMILLPGETFSYNEAVGQRTWEAGFRVAQAYSDGQVVEALGGGICQVSSTLYAATMYARLATVSRTNHYFKVSYIDYGLDATVSWGQPDFKFRNNRDYPIKIAAFTNPDDESLHIAIWGTDVDGYTVKLRHSSGEVYDEEYTDVLIGYSISTYGDVYDADGNYVETIRENAGTYYFHDEDIEWPEDRDEGIASYLDALYNNPT